MKIEGPGKTQKAGSTSKSAGISSGDSTFGDMVTGGAEETAAPSATHSIARVDALLSLQGIESPTEKASRRRMTKRADTILDELEKLRLGLLTGTLTVGDVIDIADVAAGHREKIMDPELTALLDEVDMRAQIEMAKIRMSLDAAKARAD